MAYIPPHKRHSKETKAPLPTPELLAPQFKKNLHFRPSMSDNKYKIGKMIYAGLDEENRFPSSVNLEPISLETIERKSGERPLALMNNRLDNGGSEVKWNLPKTPWVSIADNVLEDLLSSFENVRNLMECSKLNKVRPTLIARVGKFLFHGNPSVNLGSIRKDLAPEILKQSKRTFYTNMPVSYTENIVKEVVPKIGFDFEEEKDIYYVVVSDSRRPDSGCTCKCTVMKEHKKLQLYKVEDFMRNMVIDISCPNKNVDLRLTLGTKAIIRALTDDEMHSIMDLINSAVLDPDVKGGLRWPLGKASSGDKYHVDIVWHTISKTYKSPSLRLKVRDANRFDFTTLTGEAAWEVSLTLKKVESKLQEQKIDASSISETLKENMRLIWENFLCCERFPT